MTVLVQDPLIAGMAIRQTLPLHESSRRLRELYPECPRVYGIAVMGDLSRRRWWPLAEAVTTDRLQAMFEFAAEETDSRAAVAQQLAAMLAHVVVGRVVPLVVLEGRAWTPAWRTSGCTWIPRVRSTGSASSIRNCGRCPTIQTWPMTALSLCPARRR